MFFSFYLQIIKKIIKKNRNNNKATVSPVQNNTKKKYASIAMV